MTELDPPPIILDTEEEKKLLSSYLLYPERLPIHKYERNQQFWARVPDPLELLHFEGAPVSSTLRVSTK